MTERPIPVPGVMPIVASEWRKALGLSNFVNCYYQFRDLQLVPECRNVLIVGCGQGLEEVVLKWRGYSVTTYDIDPAFGPNVVGSVHDMGVFHDRCFDAVIASHVLEHLAVPYLDQALRELARIARFAVVYLPVHGRHAQVRVIPGFRGLDLSVVLDFFNFFAKPTGISPT
jgi:SAM-dependent methyltransferase